MNTSIVISVAFALISLHYAEAFFNPTIISGSGALFTGGGGPHLLLASGAGGSLLLPTAVIGAGILLKSFALLALSQSGRGKRSIQSNPNDEIFYTISSSEPSSCIRQLICDIATGERHSEYDVILSLFNKETPPTSPKYDFAVAASIGRELKSVQACELRYSCPLSGTDILNALN